MQLNPQCLCCQINKQEKRIRQFDDPERKLQYMQEICRRLSEAGPDDCAPSLSISFKEYFSKFWDVPMQDFTQINLEFNQLLMDLEDSIRAEILAAPDPLAASLVYARTGNYIDFATVPDVNPETATALLEARRNEVPDPKEYDFFCRELSQARSLVYLTDNCGEIVLDKLAIEVMKKIYPKLSITVIVRGVPTINDASMTDAKMCGLTDLVSVIGNGSNVGGTWLPGISKEAKDILYQADLIISKGQGNYETLHGCGLNIYYLFLCKCSYFVDLFHTEPLAGMFVNERRIPLL